MEPQRISRVGQTVLARLMEYQIWHQPASSVALCRRAQKRDNGLCLPLRLWESCPAALALMSDTSVLPRMPLVPFKFLPGAGAQREWVCISLCVVSLRGMNCLWLQQFLPPTQSLLGFFRQELWELIFRVLEHWAGVLVLGWDSLLLRYPSEIFIYYMWMWDQSVPCLRPSYQSGWMWFL